MRYAVVSVGLALLAGTASADDIQSYQYDVHGRLVVVQHMGTAVPGRQTAYSYDSADNRTERERTEPLVALSDDLMGEQDAGADPLAGAVRRAHFVAVREPGARPEPAAAAP